MIWSDVCIDEIAGFDLVDCFTGRVYSVDEVGGVSGDVRGRLIMRPRKIGRYVMDLDEAEDCLRRRRKFGEF